MKFNYLIVILLTLCCTLSLTSCGEELGGPNNSYTEDNEDPEDPEDPEEPEDPSEPEDPEEPSEPEEEPDPTDLSQLGKLYPLRDYIDREALPDFRLGAAVAVTEFNNKGNLYTVAAENFDQVVATYHMKHASVVGNSGSMDFTNVDKFVETCDDAGLEIFGHAFCWHISNNTTYLNSLITAAKATTTDTAKQAIAVDTAVTGAMEEWVKAMIEHTPNVKAWDVVNEPISDTSPYGYRTGEGNEGDGNFYWIDYMGDDYGRDIIGFARKYGGDDMLLFVNDYGLQWTHTNYGKLYSIIDLIEYWEEDGVTYVDGIATQMHLSYSTEESSQTYTKKGVTEMLEILATTDKLIKISELDVRLTDASGSIIKSTNITDEQHQMLADFYHFILKSYFEIIPVEQQYSVTHWTIVDPSTSASWRAGEPVGLWNESYSRKATYAGYVCGMLQLDEE